MGGFISPGELYFRDRHIVQANGVAALAAYKMHMVVVVVPLAAFILAERIAHRVIGGGNGMYNAFVDKSLQRAVNGHPVEFLAGPFFNIAVRQRTGMRQEKFQYARPAARNAQLVAF